MSWMDRMTSNHPRNPAGASASQPTGAPAPIPGPIPVPPPAAPIDPANDGFGSTGDGFDSAPVGADLNAGIPVGTGPAPGEPPTGTDGTEGTPTDGATPGEGAPTAGEDSGDDNPPPEDEGSEDNPPPDEDEDEGADQGSLTTSLEVMTTAIYAILDKNGNIVNVKDLGGYRDRLKAALKQFVDAEGIPISDKLLQSLTDRNFEWLEDAHVQRRTAGEFTLAESGEFEFAQECDEDTRRVILAAYDRRQAGAKEDSALEANLKEALEELAQLDSSKLADIADLMSAKPKKGKKLAAQDFLSTVKAKKNRETLLSLVQQEIARIKASNPDPAPTT